MAIRKIIQYPNKILRVKNDKIKDFKKVNQIIADLLDTLNKGEVQGVGLAGPQIGYNKRIFIAKEYIKTNGVVKEKDHIIINPIITYEGEKKIRSLEGCLSITYIKNKENISYSGFILRHPKIKIRFQNENGEYKEIKAKDFFATVIQHEYDHIQGKLFIDDLIPYEYLNLKEKKRVDKEIYSL